MDRNEIIHEIREMIEEMPTAELIAAYWFLKENYDV